MCLANGRKVKLVFRVMGMDKIVSDLVSESEIPVEGALAKL